MSRVSPLLDGDKFVTLTAARKLSADDVDGHVYTIKAAAGFAVTLPTKAPGMKVKFVVGTKIVSNAYTIKTSSTTADITMKGSIVTAAASLAVTTGTTSAHTITIGTNAVIGESVELVSNGSNWFFSGVSGAAAAFAVSGT